MSVILIVILTAAYFLPYFNARMRRTRNAGSVGVINLFLGWTFIGWVVALAMSSSGDVTPKKFMVPGADGNIIGNFTCAGCGEQGHGSNNCPRKIITGQPLKTAPAIDLPSQPKSHVTMEAMKEEIFQLESDRVQGKISLQDYQTAKATLDKILQRVV
jgi:Superinfection immunity protein